MKRAIHHLTQADPVLGTVIERVGSYRMKYVPPEFGSLVRSIVYQQLSGRVASVIFGRLAAATGEPIRPEAILSLRDEQMRQIGLSRQKALYVRDLAARAEEIGFERLPKLSDEQVIERLTAVKGVGVWTAQMFLIFALRRRDVLPVLDLGIRTAVKNVYGLKELPAPRDLELVGERWRPYCSVASWYLWRSLEPEYSAEAKGL
jgi:DNA-3-methyladenine glycosylase II